METLTAGAGKVTPPVLIIKPKRNANRERYAAVNALWPKEVPALTGPEAVAAVKLLYRFALKKAWAGKVELTSGNRYSWPRGRVWKVNPDRGWAHLVHMVSHYTHTRRPNLSPEARKDHGTGHASWERYLIAEVIRRGWLTGSLKPKAKAAPVAQDRESAQRARAAKIDSALKRWESKRRRAETAIAKLQKQRRYYARIMLKN